MKGTEVLHAAADAMTVRRVYGEPVERDGVTVIPAAFVTGGGGGGSGKDDKGQEGDGGGFGLLARPAGAFVIRDGKVSWRPALDLNQLLAVAGAVTVVGLCLWARARRSPARRSRTR